MPNALPVRSELQEDFTWDVGSVFSSDAEWSVAFDEIQSQISDFAGFRGTLGTGPDALADWQNFVSDVYVRLGRVYVYASMLHGVDTADASSKAKVDRATSLYSEVGAAASFADPEMLEIGSDTLTRWAEEDERLTIYLHYFDTLEQRKAHVRSTEVEGLLGNLDDSFSSAQSIHRTLVDTDMTFAPARGSSGTETVPAQGNIAQLLTDSDREVRRTAWENYADAHLAVQNTLAGTLSTGVKQHVFLARARRYNSCLEAALQPNHIPLSVFHNLIDTFRTSLPIWHRYWRVRREALGYDALHVYDIKAPLVSSNTAIPYAQAVEWVADGMKPLGDEYVEVLKRGCTSERWVDVYPNQHKTSGAYSNGSYSTHPFILMSYSDDIFSMSTLAHELGHSMHSYFTRKHQPFVYSRYGLFLAEIASNFNQALVRAHLLRSTQEVEFKISIIEEAMSNFHRYLFVMPTLARFELEIHERVERGMALTAQDLNGLCTELFAEAYGTEVEVDAPRVGVTWAQFPSHLYANFYVYQYATGIAAANALAQPILQGDTGAVDRYLTFLRSGGSEYPLQTLRRAGVDITSPEPVRDAFAALTGLIDDLENLVRTSKKTES